MKYLIKEISLRKGFLGEKSTEFVWKFPKPWGKKSLYMKNLEEKED